jgi:hypothetical protein
MAEQKSQPDSNDPENSIIPTAETSGITRLSRTDSETEGAHLRRVADELSGSGEERLMHLSAMLSSRKNSERLSAALELGKIGSLRAIQLLRDLLVSGDESSWLVAIHGLRTGGSREGWLCLEGVAQDDADRLGSDDEVDADTSFRRLISMGRTKTMDRLFRAADGHSRSIPGDVARRFSQNAANTLPADHKRVMEHRLGLVNGSSATPTETATAMGVSLDDVRLLELEGWQSIHSPAAIDE